MDFYNELKERLLTIAQHMAQRGAGYGQESVVLREAEKQLGEWMRGENAKYNQLLKRQQLILTAWNDLFRERRLSWGYDIDNPNAPFFHLTEAEAQQDAVSPGASMGP